MGWSSDGGCSGADGAMAPLARAVGEASNDGAVKQILYRLGEVGWRERVDGGRWVRRRGERGR